MTEKIITALLEITAYSAVLFAAVMLFRLLMKKHLSPMMLYITWFLVIARLVVPVTLDSGFSLFVIRPGEATQAEDFILSDTPVINDNGTDTSGGVNTAVIRQSDNTQKQPAADIESVSAGAPPGAAVMQATPARIDWNTTLIALWLCGAGLMLAQTAVSVIRLKLKLKRYGLPAPAIWLEIAERIKADVGVACDLRILTVNGFASPALSVSLKPAIIIPGDKLGDAGQAELILRHELTHLKRRDHIVCLLLIALRIVYWFNPVVWLTVKHIKLDMETACDSMVVASMNGAEKKRYAGTVLGMFAREKAKYVLGMALGGTKKTAERRIRGMYMRRRSSSKARFAAAVLAAVMLVACFTTACQPTPETPAVVGKDQGKMLEAAQQTQQRNVPLPERVGAPEKYEADIAFADGKMTIKADAPVILPDTERMPTMRVQAADFTQEQVDSMISALFGGQKIYETQYGPETKDEIAATIVNYEKMKASDEYSSEGDQAHIDEELNRLKAQYETAPEKSEDITTESDGQLKQKEIKDQDDKHMAYYMGIDVSTNPEDYETAATLQVRNNNDMKEAVFEITDHGGGGMPLRRCATLSYSNAANRAFTNWGQHDPIPVDENTVIDDPDVLAKLKTTPAQAKAAAETLLENAGIDYMSVCAMYLVDDENLGNYDGIVSPAGNYAYRICVRRIAGGAPCAYLHGYTSSGGGLDAVMKQSAEGGQPDMSGLKYVGEWEYERVTMVMNDQGVITFDWYSPVSITETVVEDSALLPFERITAAFEQRMRDTYEPQARVDHVVSMDFKVDHVALELQRIAEQDSLETGLFVPVWNFYGTETDGYDDMGNVITNKNGFNEPRTIMSVNAIDASVILNEVGY